MKIKTIALLIFALFAQTGFAAFDSADFSQQKSLIITRITPNGEDVPAGRQIVFQFNRPVVPIGRMERDESEVPVSISPALECQWRWINTNSLACQLSEKNKLQQATHYTITMNPGIYAADGTTLDALYTHRFITQRPKVRYARFANWQSPGTPVIRLTFNQSVTKTSVTKQIAFVYQQNDQPSITQEVQVEPDPNDWEKPRYIPIPGESAVLDFGAETTARIDDGPQIVSGEEARRVWLVSPQKALPLDTNINLDVTPGLISAFGGETGTEDRTIVNFDTFPEFTLLGVICRKNDGEQILITPENSHEVGKCSPLGGTALSFSSPVLASQVKNNILIDPDLAGRRTDYDPWAKHVDHSRLARPHRKDSSHNVWLPEHLQAAQRYTIKTKSANLSMLDQIRSWFTNVRSSDLQDEFGRHLKHPIDFHFLTDHRLPNFELTHKTAVLEQQTDSDVPLYITNLDSVTFDYTKITTHGTEIQQSLQIDTTTQAQDIQFAIPMRIREMLDNESGAVYGTITTQPNIEKYITERTLFASVSPYQLHVKIGHYNTLVWVTDLATGEPVENAQVQIYQDQISNLSATFKTLDKASTDASGLALLQGTNTIDPELDLFSWCRGRNQNACGRLFVRVDKVGEMAIMPLENRFAVSVYRASNATVWANTQRQYGHIHSWGTTAQGVYRAGDTIQYKFYVRDQDNQRYVAAPRETYTLEVIDPTGKTIHEIKEIVLSAFGSYSGEYRVPESAAVGWYEFKLSGNFSDEYTWRPMRVLVSDFTPSSFKVVNSLNGDLFHPGEEMEISSSAKLHSGGAYTDAEARITATLIADYFSSKHPVASGFTFDSYQDRQTKRLFQKSDNIGNTGEIRNRFTLPEENIVFGRLTVESAVRDDRGKYLAASSTADYVAVDRLVGLKQTKWLHEEDKPADIQYIVVNEHGTPTADTRVILKIAYLQTKAAKVKGAGNAYLTNYVDEWIAAGSCEGTSSTEPGICRFIPEEPGTYKITASIEDTKGNTHVSETQARVTGKGRVIWRSPDDNSLQIIPEKTEYNIGDRARYLIKNPYPGAKALISIERYGVLKSWVQELESSTPVIEFDIETDFMPGFYLSAVVVSPRVAKPLPEIGQVDLGKPAFKIGYIEVPVKDPYKQIDVSVKTDLAVYKPGDNVTVTIHAEPKNKDKNEQIEIAVAVLDEAVLDLIQDGKTYFDPYTGFYQLDGLDLGNYSLLTRLIGRQQFAKKGANPGGDGGADVSIRNQKRTTAYWNPSIVLSDDQLMPASEAMAYESEHPVSDNLDITVRANIQEGIYWADNVTVNHQAKEAKVQFRLPDNLTGWRILAFAVTPTDRMGLGDTSFKVNRPTEIRPVMPNQITEGDIFEAGFSVMNRTDKPREITVSIQATGHIKPTGEFTKTLRLEPYKRQTVYMPVTAMSLPQTGELKTGAIHFTARAADTFDGDGVKHIVPVYKRRSLETATNYGTTTKDRVSESIRFPERIHTDVGAVSVMLSPSVIGSVDGAFRYMRDYPYSCWEQKLTKGIMASHYQNLKDYLQDELIWDESKALPTNILQQAANYQAPNGGMAYFIPQDHYVSPYLSAYTALAFNWLRDSGHAIPETVESELHAYLERLLRKNIVPTFYSRGMSATVRSVALAALAKHGKVNLDDLERYRSHIPHMSLFGKAHYLQATVNTDGATDIAREVTAGILAHASQSGGKFSFNEELDDSYARILATPLRANCGILSAVTQYGETKTGAALVGDVPFKLVRSITQARDNRNHWENTQENVFCMNGLIDYARLYENVKPNMQLSVTLDTETLGSTHFKSVRDNTVTLSRPVNADDPGKKRTVTLSRQGAGRLYYATQIRYASLDDHANRLNAGIDIRKEYSVERDNQWILLDNSAEIKRGELVRVDIYVSLPTARYFVVVDDPVPGGLEPVNRDLATSSSVDADKGTFQAAGESWWFQFDDWQYFNISRWGFYHKELRHNAVRFYSDYLAAGNYHLSYTAQAIAVGEFSKMPTHAEEMYTPDVFGKDLPGTLKIDE